MLQLARLLFFGVVALGLATAWSYTGRWTWSGDLLVTFRTHFTLLAIVLLATALAMRRWRYVAASAVLVALNAWPLWAMFAPTTEPAVADARQVRVVAFNVHVTNDDINRVAAYLDELAPDVVILEEVPLPNAEGLRQLLPALPEFHFASDLGLGVAMLSRWPLRDIAVVAADGVKLGLRADVDLGDRHLRVYGVHLLWPLVPAAAAYRDAQLAGLGAELARCEGACMVAGDFNITPWSTHYRRLLAVSGFRDCARGRGWLPTWTAALPSILRIRIDQCLASGAVGVADVCVGDAAGSDHFVTINDLLVGRD